ncbi:DUF6624 domain-containing protein [Niabella drilacis]|uniref:Uncharacterized protein n=1 Tax=Niabella drilacis (strain DSM 25811 / CCM 8410 / CCUG 62505 / LMG 26954 / E90) TaxID=1285928 RepID=A0A1G6J346_NIADE|nr:DUF6624 domain-containing protein [Niabella drilacis]SDC13090.1 hypothetical protein SAMN04487894_101404 [Niabella drilacis]
MNSKKLFILIFLTGFNLTVFSQITSYNFDPNKVNKELAHKMDSLYQEDQKYRSDWIRLRQEGASKEQLDSIKSIVRMKDSSNVIFATQLLDKYGWLGPQNVGLQGTQALFLIIQHANLETQKKYYPIILQAEKEGNILSSNVAIMEDRIAVREGREQTYGSQGYYDSEKKKTFIYPLLDFENLDKLRKSRGLEPMKEYIKDWDVSDYISYLPYAKELLKKLKEAN